MTSVRNVKEEFIDKAKDPKDSFRLMGFGHRVYKNFAQKNLLEVLARKKISGSIFGRNCLKDDYFIERKLYPNVDFYSGIIYRAMDIPTNMFTVMFTLGRISGWLAHWKEMYKDANFRIGRPRQIYQGSTERDYIPIEKRN